MKTAVFAIILLYFAGQSSSQKVWKCQVDSDYPEKCIFNSVEIKTGDNVVLSAENSMEKSIETIDFKASTVETIPPQLFQSFTNLKNLWIVGHKLETIENDTFENATNLRNMYLNYHDLKSLEENTFEGANNLSMIHVCCGAMAKIDPKAFDGLSELEILILGRNKIDLIDPATFQGLVKLNKLYLDHNQLEKLNSNTFKTLENLHWIKLNGNRLETLPKDLFLNNLKIDTIELQENRLSLVPSDIFSHLTNLNKLSLSNNECVDVDFESNAYNQTQEIEKSLESCTITFHKYVKLTYKLDKVLEENQGIKESISAIAEDVEKIKEKGVIATAECKPVKTDFDCVKDLGQRIKELQDKICFIA